MQRGRFLKWFVILVLEVCFLKTEALLANITYVESAVAKGAVCLDGSPPAYHFDKGFGAGINNWLVHIEGGGWCNNVTSCLARKNTKLGSSKLMVKQLAFSGILTNIKKYNPDFYNWNRVKIGYCDGSSFTGDIEAVNPTTNLHFRGARIFVAVVMDLLARGMKNAENALLSGCSAGGLTSIIHCDSFQALLPMGTKVKCLSDAGFFLNTKDVSGAHRIEAYFKNVVTTHGSTKNLPLSCTSVMSNPHLCFFPRNLAKQIQTPLFILNAAYDSWQIRNILAPDIADPYGFWRNCKRNFTCSSTQLKTLQDFRLEYIWDISNLGKSIARGLFINSCFAHCQTETQETWFMPNSPSLDGIRIATAIGDWFYDRKPFQKIDCPFPCDKTCHNRIYENEYEIA